MKFCPVCDKRFTEGASCPDDGAVLMPVPEERGDPLLGVVLKDSYQVDEKIGEGGMGSVYRAKQQPLGRAVAVKILRSDSQDSTQSIKRFYREAKTLSTLSHPNVVSLIDFGNTEAGLFFLVMEMLQGETLFDAVPETLPWSPERLTTVFAQICAGVGAAHKSGLIHRDLKPSNIFIAKNSDDSETVKVLDFGIAKIHDDDSVSRLTQTGSVVGTIGYIAPEVMTGEQPASPQSDIYSLGALLYLVLTGNTAYDGPSTRSIILKQLKDPPPLPDFTQFGFSNAFAPVLHRAMAIDPNQRFTTTEELAHAIRDAAQQPLGAQVPGRVDRATPMPRSVMMDLGSVVMEVDPNAQTARELLPEDRGTVTHMEEVPNLRTGHFAPIAPEDTLQATGGPAAQISPASAGSQSNSAADSSPKAPTLPTPPQTVSAIQKGKKSTLGPIAGLVAIIVLAGLTWLSWKSGLLPGSQPLPEPDVTSASANHQGGNAGIAVPAPATPTPPLAVGVDDKHVVLGMSSATTGPTQDLGIGVWHGAEAKLRAENARGGVYGRQLKLVHLDDGYEPDRAKANTQELIQEHKVFGILSSMGTPTSEVALPLVLDAQVLFFGALSGGNFLEKDPPDRYVFNFRPRYSEEVKALLTYLVKLRGIKPYQISAFAQDDAFGEDGVQAMIKTLRKLGHKKPEDIFVTRYTRNSNTIKTAAEELYKHRALTKAVLMISTSQPAAELLVELRKRKMKSIFCGVSAIANPDFATSVMAHNPKYLDGVVISQVVPDPMSRATGVTRFRQDFTTAFPDEQPSPAALEGYISASILIDAMQRQGRKLTSEGLIDTLEKTQGLDLGIGAVCHFAPSDHQCSHKVWGTVLDAEGNYLPMDLE